MLYEQVESNKKKTVAFMCIFFLLFQILGAVMGKLLFRDIYYGVFLSSIVLLIYMSITVLRCQSIVMRMNNAVKIDREDNPQLFNIVEEVCVSAGLRKIPDIYIVVEDSPNAFATGLSPEKASIGVTTALLEKLNREELEGVIAHEIGHIMNYDTRLSTITIALMSAIIFLCDLRLRFDDDDDKMAVIFYLIFIILAPIVAQVLQFAISRNREYLADATAVTYTRNPHGLISALNKLDNDSDKVDNISSTCACMYIVDPLKKNFNSNGEKKKRTFNLFSTHPLIEDRIDRLNKM